MHTNINFLWFKSCQLFLLSFVTLANKIFLNNWPSLKVLKPAVSCEVNPGSWGTVKFSSQESSTFLVPRYRRLEATVPWVNLARRQHPDVLPLARLLPQGKRLKLTSFLEIYLKIKYVQLIGWTLLLSKIDFTLYISLNYKFQTLTPRDGQVKRIFVRYLYTIYTGNIYFDKFKIASENS